MPILDDISGWLAARLPELLAEHQVPGAAIGVEATVDSVFQIGSITKT